MSNQAKAVNGSGLVSDISRGGGRPTMKDVATRAGVALKTVSRVVNGEPGVTPETAQRVLGAIEDLGFRRNESARLLRTGHTATLGFIADTWTDPDHAAVYRGLENVAREHGYLLYSGSTDRDPASRGTARARHVRPPGRRADHHPHPRARMTTWSRRSRRAWPPCSCCGRRSSCAPTRCCPMSAAARRSRSRTWRAWATGGSGFSASPRAPLPGPAVAGTRRRWRRPGSRPTRRWLTPDAAALAGTE